VAYEQLGMGTHSDLNDYIRLYDYCRHHSRHVTAMKSNWTTKLLALKTYRDIHGDMLIPQRFVVPTDDQRWPIETHGMKLGTVVNNLRQRKTSLSQNQLDALDELGFEWNVSVDENWKKKLLALKTFRDIHGHVRVPILFVIPTDDKRWPIITHGVKLGKITNYLRQNKISLPQNRIDALETLGFEWGKYFEKSWKNKLLALKTYKDTHGHARVPQSFVVPTDDQRWPIETHNMKLGKVVNDLRQRKISLSRNQVDDLEALEFDWGVSLDEHWRKNLLALATYEEINGHMRVPQSFVVPADDEL
jgi:hypothetical protein